MCALLSRRGVPFQGETVKAEGPHPKGLESGRRDPRGVRAKRDAEPRALPRHRKDSTDDRKGKCMGGSGLSVTGTWG
jgi:hypothetical protein